MDRLTPEQCQRLKAAREAKGLRLDQAAQQVGITNHQLYLWETHGFIIPSFFLRLAHDVYHTSLHEILAGPYPYTTPEQWMTAWINEEISEGTLAQGLNTDVVDARRQVQAYQREWID